MEHAPDSHYVSEAAGTAASQTQDEGAHGQALAMHHVSRVFRNPNNQDVEGDPIVDLPSTHGRSLPQSLLPSPTI